MTVEKGIKKIIENKFGNVKYFSEEIDLPYTTVRSILERGVLNAKVENVIKIAEGLDMDPKEFLKLDRENIMVADENQTMIDNLLDIMKDLNINRKEKVYNFANKQLKEQQNNIVELKQFKDIELYSTLSAGTGVVDLEPNHVETISYGGYIPDHYDMAFKVQGDSMEPVFEDGEVVFVESDSEVRNGQFGAVLINGEAYIKKMYIENEVLRLVSLNKKYDDIIANENDEIKVVGRVII